MAKNNTNYLKFYADYYGINWDHKKFQIHHIDGDHENNSIENLVLLPKELHQLFHKTQVHDYSFGNSPAETFDDCRARFEMAVFNGFNDWLFGNELPCYLEMMTKMEWWGYIKRMNSPAWKPSPQPRRTGWRKKALTER